MNERPDFDVPFQARRSFLQHVQQAASRQQRDGRSVASFPQIYGTDHLGEGVARLWRELGEHGVVRAENGYRLEQFSLDRELRPQLVLDDGYRIVAPDSHAISEASYRSVDESQGVRTRLQRQLSDLIDLLAGEALDLAAHLPLGRAAERAAAAPLDRADVVQAAQREPRPSSGTRHVITSPTGEDLVIE